MDTLYNENKLNQYPAFIDETYIWLIILKYIGYLFKHAFPLSIYHSQ